MVPLAIAISTAVKPAPQAMVCLTPEPLHGLALDNQTFPLSGQRPPPRPFRQRREKSMTEASGQYDHLHDQLRVGAVDQRPLSRVPSPTRLAGGRYSWSEADDASLTRISYDPLSLVSDAVVSPERRFPCRVANMSYVGNARFDMRHASQAIFR